MTSNIQYPKRKIIRLPNYDYSTDGAYHVILCTEGKRMILADLTRGADDCSPPKLTLSEAGKAADNVIRLFDGKYPYARITEYCIMPNHIHLLIEYSGGNEQRLSLSAYVSRLKSSITIAVGSKICERNFYEHVIRGESDYLATIEYIRNNPSKWVQDDYYPKNR